MSLLQQSQTLGQPVKAVNPPFSWEKAAQEPGRQQEKQDQGKMACTMNYVYMLIITNL